MGLTRRTSARSIGAWALAAAAAVALGASAGVATAVPLPPTPAPLPGGTFQGGDGDQVAAAGLTDWDTLVAEDRVVPSPDPNTDDNVFAGGTKELEPGEWDLTTQGGGATPPKDNVRDAWSAVEQVGGHTFLHLAFRRQAGNGTTAVFFELNQDPRVWDNGLARIPCRTTGDIVVAFEQTGQDPEITVDRWTTLTSDPGTGCARTGTFADAATLTPNVDVQAAVNVAEIQNVLPGALGSPILVRRFGEATLDLGAVMSGAGRPCFAFASVWMHTRSSRSVTSQMQDYVAPRPLTARRCTASGTKFLDENRNGVRDAGEPGLARFVIWADYNGDGVLQAGEPSTHTDASGNYLIQDIRPPDGTYTLREQHAEVLHVEDHLPWICSFPGPLTAGGFNDPSRDLWCGWGPIDVAATPNATRRDFGNHLPVPEPPVVPEVPREAEPGPVNVGGVVSVPVPAQVRGRAALTGPRACVRQRLPILVQGTRMVSLRVSIDGRTVRRANPVRTQRRVPLVLDVSGLRPGRHRVSVRVTFRLGSGTRPVTLSRPFGVCVPIAPRFTG